MSDIRDFRKIADEAMWNINVTDEMKNEVLRKCGQKQHVRMPALRIAAAAACGVIVAGMLYLAGILKQILPDHPGNAPESQQPGIFSAADNAADNQEVDPADHGMGIMSEQVKQWQPASLEEAGKNFGEGFLIPSGIPDEYGQADIYASGNEIGQADRVVISYSTEEHLFEIIEEKTNDTVEFADFEEVDINGVKGYLMSEDMGTETYYTQLCWTDNGIMYTIVGSLTRQEAIEIARAMNIGNRQ